MSGAVQDLKNLVSNPLTAVNPFIAASGYAAGAGSSAPDLPSPGNVNPPEYNLNPPKSPSTDAETYASRQRAAAAAAAAPGSASSILTNENDPLGTKRQRLLGL